MEKNELALVVYGKTYDSLSAWGKAEIDSRVAHQHSPLISHVKEKLTAREENQRLALENEQLRLENLELYDENSELKAELEEVREEWNKVKASSRRSSSS